MESRTIGVARFKATCLKVNDDMSRDGRPVTITRRGRPVAVLSPAGIGPTSIIGAMAGTVGRYDEPFAPAVEPTDWNAFSGPATPPR